MPALQFTLYPRITSTSTTDDPPGAIRRAGSVVGDLFASPAIFAAGQEDRIEFSDIVSGFPAAPVHHPENGAALCLHLRLLKLDSAASPTTTELLTGADVGLGPNQVRVTVIEATDTAPPVFEAPTIGFSSSFSTAPDTALMLNASGEPFAFQAVQFDATSGLFRIYVDPFGVWDASTAAFKLALVIHNGLAQPLSAVFTVAVGTNAAGAPDLTVLNRPWIHCLAPATITSAGDLQDATLLNFGPADASLPTPVGTVSSDFNVTTAAATASPGDEALLTFGTTATGGSPTALFTLDASVDDTDSATSGAADAQLDDVLHRRRFDVSAQLGALELLMVLDASGSMGWRLGSNSSAPLGERRWDYLIEGLEAVRRLIETQADPATDRAAVSIFPAHEGGSTNQFSARVFPHGPALSVLDAVVTEFGSSGFSPSGGTPMRAGLEQGLAQFPFAPSAPQNRRRLVLMTDGDWNNGGDPLDQDLPSDPVLTQIRDHSVRAAVVRLGDQTGLGQITLETLANGDYTDPRLSPTFVVSPPGDLTIVEPGAAAVDATPGVFDKDSSLVLALIDSVADVLDLDVGLDPTGVVTPASPTTYHEFVITDCDRTATVAVCWTTPQRDRLSVSLVTPLCEVITPGFEDPGVQHGRGPSHQQFFFTEAFLRGDGAERDRYGTWRLFVELNEDSPDSDDSPDSGSPAPGPDPGERYEYRVWSASCLRLEAGLTPNATHTGQLLPVRARLTKRGAGVSGATVSGILTRPTNSYHQFLAETPASPESLERANRELGAAGVTDPWDIKAAALGFDGRRFVQETAETTFTLEPRAAGRYERDLGPFCTPGTYRFRVVAQGALQPGVPLYREASFTTRLVPVLDPANTTVTVQFAAEGPGGVVCWRPRDSCGNPVLYNPLLEEPFRVELRGGRFTGPPRVVLDGSYCRDALFDEGERPVVEVFPPGSSTPVLTVGLPSLPDLIWCDRLLAHKPGFDQKANQHADPSAILGPVTSAHDAFLSLGALGEVVVAAERVPKPKEVCVVIREEPGDLRAYSVEICTGVDRLPSAGHHGECRWVEVGRSIGVTQCFSLASAGEDRVAAVRIRDRSRRALVGGQLSATPGVSVFGVGFVADAVEIDLDRATVGGSESVQLGERVQLIEGCAPVGVVFNSGEKALAIAPDAKVGSVFSVGDVRLAQRVLVAGDVWTSGELVVPQPPGGPNQPVVTGSVHQGVPLDLPSLERFVVEIPPGASDDVHLPPRAARTLAPGSYRHVHLAPYSQLTLTASSATRESARYYFESLVVEPNALLIVSQVSGIVEIFVRQTITYRGSVSTQPHRANLLLVSLASGTTFLEAPFRGTAVAPHGTLHLRGGSRRTGGRVHHGAFYAQHLIIEPDWKIVHVARD